MAGLKGREMVHTYLLVVLFVFDHFWWKIVEGAAESGATG